MTAQPAAADSPVYFMVHVPKCAGTTVEEHFRRSFGEGAGFLMAPRWNSPLRHVLGNRTGLRPEALSGVQVVSGHSLFAALAASFPGRPVRECVLLRDPVGYLVSFYNYRLWRAEAHGDATPPPFEIWLKAQRRNGISRFLLVRYFGMGYPGIYGLSATARLAWLEARLARFHFVGSYKRCTEMLAGVSQELGVSSDVEDSNVTRTKALSAADVTGPLRAQILRDHALDAALYDRWRNRGFDGAPEGPAPDLPRHDHLAALASDIETAIRKKMWR